MSASLSSSELVGSPGLHVQQLDMTREMLLLLRLSEAQLRAASFLDDRVLEQGQPIGWVPFGPVASAAAHILPRPLHFIFHAGHVGSTLLSRLLDQMPGVLGLREPLPLRTLALMHDAGAPEFSRALAAMLQLWGRGFADTQTVILKATSNTGRIAPVVAAAVPAARAVYLNLAAEPYITTLMAGDNTVSDLEGHTPERLSRLQRILGVTVDADGPLSLGEGAAVAWLAERLAQARAAAAMGPRLLSLDFESMLADMPGTLGQVLAHFGLPRIEAELAQSPILTRYAKLPETHRYSTQLRRDLLEQTRAERAEDIAHGLALLDRLGARHPAVAVVLDNAVIARA